jgi:hypothetical protein
MLPSNAVNKGGFANCRRKPTPGFCGADACEYRKRPNNRKDSGKMRFGIERKLTSGAYATKSVPDLQFNLNV